MKYKDLKTTYLRDYTPSDYLISKVDLHFNLGKEYTDVVSNLTVEANPLCPQRNKDLVLHGEDLTLLSVKINDIELPADRYRVDEKTLTIRDIPGPCSLTITTRIKPQENTELRGLYKSSGNFTTQCEAEGFRRITYYLDRPDVLSCFTTTITADAKEYPMLVSNGNCVRHDSLPNGKHSITWDDPFKKPAYLFALVGGNFDLVEDSYRTQSGRLIKLQMYAETGYGNRCVYALQALKSAMKWDEEHYGRECDLDTYKIVAISDFNMGAMENKGLNIFNAKYVLATPETATDDSYTAIAATIAHEYFHNWTGNRVTICNWFQLSLKEGLTTFREHSFIEDTVSPVERYSNANYLRVTQFPEDAGPMAHSVRPDSYVEIANFYTPTVYRKGAELFRMLRTIVGPENYRKGTDLYFQRNDGKAVAVEEFVQAIADASGIDLTQFMLWFRQAGTPTLDVQDDYLTDQQTYILKVRQSCPATPGQAAKVPMLIPLKFGLLDANGHEVQIEKDLLLLHQEYQEFRFTGITSKPVPSLLRGFSAPVKLNYEYTDEDLRLLFMHDTDVFSRLDAGQRYKVNYMTNLMRDFHEGRELKLSGKFIDMFSGVLNSHIHDPWLLAEMLSLPTERYLAEQMAVVDIEAISVVRDFVIKQLAVQLQSAFLDLYQHCNTSTVSPVFNSKQAGWRSVKNSCLNYLIALGDPRIVHDLAIPQFNAALSHNMTDAQAVLRSLADIDGPERTQTLEKFYKRWKQDPHVMDDWLEIQAGSHLPTTVADIRRLMQHEVFDIRNPNKVGALIGYFARSNLTGFHHAGGEGYALLADVVLQLDTVNADIAAWLLKPLTMWKRYDDRRQELMLAQLRHIQSHATSTGVLEIVGKSLANAPVLHILERPKSPLVALSVMAHPLPVLQLERKPELTSHSSGYTS